MGNQLFQIATAFATSLRNGTSYAVSKETNEGINGRRGVTDRTSYNDNIFKALPKCDTPRGIPVYSEKGFHYSGGLPSNKNLFIRGYFQSEKYFRDFRKDILDLIWAYYPNVREYIPLMHGETISVHVRRSDYVQLSDTHPVQTIDYYRKALAEFNENATLVVFSDDIAWCKQQSVFHDWNNVHFMEPRPELSNELNSVIDLYAMAKCTHNIICNSSFSWWGSYLNTNESKRIIAPAKWFAQKGPKNWSDVYTRNMKVI